MIESTILGVIELAGGVGITSIVTNGAIKAVPQTVGTLEKICVGIGTGMSAIAVERIVVRECNGYYKDLKKEIRKITKKRNAHYNKKYEKK